MTEKNELRWVQYPCLIAGERVVRFGLFLVHFIDDAPAHAKLARVDDYKRDDNDFMKAKQAFARASELATLLCTNAVNLDDWHWQGTLTFDHLPVLD